MNLIAAALILTSIAMLILSACNNRKEKRAEQEWERKKKLHNAQAENIFDDADKEVEEWLNERFITNDDKVNIKERVEQTLNRGRRK